MAKLLPSYEEILTLKQKPTERELYLFTFLNEILDSTYTIYFQPFLNELLPDIIVTHPDRGVLIIEAKDYNIDSYYVSESKW
jgi:hypothetical protein